MDSREPRGNGSQAPGTVLVVEDDEATRAFLLDNLAADGFRVAGASGAAEGLRAIEVRHPALVVLDLVLEDGSGLALLDRVRASDGLSSRIDPDLPVIVLSGRAGDADRVRSFARGADDHLCKPTRYLFFRFVEPHSGLRGSLHSGGRGCRPDEPHARDRSLSSAQTGIRSQRAHSRSSTEGGATRALIAMPRTTRSRPEREPAVRWQRRLLGGRSESRA
jgi:CheY-like chemotaxis protein